MRVWGRNKMRKTLFILVVIIFLSLSTPVFAGNEIIDYLSLVIYKDCQGTIDISPVIFRLAPNITDYVGDQVTVDIIKEIVKVIVDNEPYDIQTNIMTETSAKSGTALLKCGDKQLDANFNSYRWNGERVDPFIYNINQTISQVLNQIGTYKSQASQCIGENCISENKQRNLFSDNNLYLTIGLSIAFSLISVGILEIVLYFRRREKQRKSNEQNKIQAN